MIVNMASTWPVIMCLCACDSLVHMQHGWSQPFARCEDIFVCWMFMIHCVSSVPSEPCVCSVNTAGAASSCVCVCVFFEQIQDTLSKRPQADGVDAYLRQTGLTLHTGCLQFTHTYAHIQPNWQVAQAPEEQDFPASQYEPLGSPQQQTERWRREV